MRENGEGEVNLILTGTISVSANTSTQLAIISERVRPKNSLTLSPVNRYASTQIGSIGSDGKLNIHNPTSQTTVVCEVNITYSV